MTSIFVNPLQFGAGDDLDRYPRTLERDLERCAEHGVDVVFVPSVEEVYPGGEPEVTVEPGPRALLLEGASRPGHFRGVLTVVAKLFGLVRPDVAVFGEKDYQQLVLIRRMTRDLCLGIDVQGAPTVRDPDGLALSSRNRFLSGAEREQALTLSAALAAGREAGVDGADATVEAARATLAAGGVDPDYLALTDPDLGEGAGHRRGPAAAGRPRRRHPAHRQHRGAPPRRPRCGPGRVASTPCCSAPTSVTATPRWDCCSTAW